MLLTSRDTRRWMIPKGNIEPGQTPLEAADAKALEEAGVQGVFDIMAPIGAYNYRKALKTGESRPIIVKVYVLRMTAILKKWREQKRQDSVWLPLSESLDVIEEPGATPLPQRLQALEDTLIDFVLRAPARKK